MLVRVRDSLYEDTVELIVGSQHVVNIGANKKLLARFALFFELAEYSNKTSRGPSNCLKLPNYDPELMRIFNAWTYTGLITPFKPSTDRETNSMELARLVDL